jgi:hypothetical protein
MSVKNVAQTVVRGVVISAINNQPMDYVSVAVFEIIDGKQDRYISGTESNIYGYFSITIHSDTDTVMLKLSAPLCQSQTYKISTLGLDTVTFLEEFIMGEVISNQELLLTRLDAIRDIENGIVQLYIYGCPTKKMAKMNKVAKQFGFQYTLLGNGSVDANILQSIYKYNSVVKRYIEEKNGIKWTIKFKRKAGIPLYIEL